MAVISLEITSRVAKVDYATFLNILSVAHCSSPSCLISLITLRTPCVKATEEEEGDRNGCCFLCFC